MGAAIRQAEEAFLWIQTARNVATKKPPRASSFSFATRLCYLEEGWPPVGCPVRPSQADITVVLLASRWAGRLRPLGPLPRAGVGVSLQPQTERGHGGRHLPQVVGPQVRSQSPRSIRNQNYVCSFQIHPPLAFLWEVRAERKLQPFPFCKRPLNFTLPFLLQSNWSVWVEDGGWRRLRD